MSRGDGRLKAGRVQGAEKKVRYGLLARMDDRICATRDARAGIPALPEADQLSTPQDAAADSRTGLTTARRAYLDQLGRGRAEQEWTRYEADVAEDIVRHSKASAECQVAVARLTETEERYEATSQPSEAELAVVVPGEERTDSNLRRGRRNREFTERRGTLEAEIRSLRVAVDQHRVDMAGLHERVRRRHDLAQSRVAVIDAYIGRRQAAYLARLLRKHPDGGRLAGSALWTTHSAWSTREFCLPVTDLELTQRRP